MRHPLPTRQISICGYHLVPPLSQVHSLTLYRMCEEVNQPATQVPKAMVATIVLNLICGLVFLIPLVFVMPDQAVLAALASGQPVPSIIKSAVGSPGAAIGLLTPLLVLGLFCGIGCTTAASRCTWAFARDGAIPGAKWWKTVNAKLDVPLNAMMLSMVVQILLGLIYFGSTAAYNAFSGVGVICLTLSYACPIVASLLEGRRAVKEGKFYLGALGTFCNVVALGNSHFVHPPNLMADHNAAWSALAVPLFCMPTAVTGLTPDLMNYASVVFFAFFVISTAWYFIWGKKNYEGPPMTDDAVLQARRPSVVHQYVE
jgi:amino acid transporter